LARLLPGRGGQPQEPTGIPFETPSAVITVTKYDQGWRRIQLRKKRPTPDIRICSSATNLLKFRQETGTFLTIFVKNN